MMSVCPSRDRPAARAASGRAGGSTIRHPGRCVTGRCAVACLLSAPLPVAAAGSGEVSVGWREVSVDGTEAKYRQHVNLDEGPRLFALAFEWREDAGGNGDDAGPDRLELRLSNLGGDPYESIGVTAERQGRYRARYRRHESEYFYEDILVLPENASVEGSTGGDFRHFDFRRTRDTASLELTLSERATAQLEFDRYAKRGESTSVLDVEREEFELEQPIDETMESAAAGVSYAWDRVTVTWNERYSTFDYDSSLFLPGLSQGSEADAPTRLDFFFLDQPYRQRAWEHRLDVRARPGPRLDLGLSVLLADVDVELEALERSQGVDFAGIPFERNVQGEGALDQDRVLYRLAAGYRVGDRLRLFGRLRFAELEQSGASTFESPAESDWNVDTAQLEGGVEVVPAAGWLVALGWAGDRRDVNFVQSEAEVTDRAAVETDSSGWFLRASFRPSSRADLHLSVEDYAIDDPFTLSSATDATRYRLRGRLRWDNGMAVSVGWLRRERDNDDSGWGADIEQTDVRVGYDGSALSLSAGYTDVRLSRGIDVLVTGGAAQQLFDIDYDADASFFDASMIWRVAPSLSAGVAGRVYDNDGSFAVDRDDARVFLRGRLGQAYQWGVEYRRIEFREADIERFDADVLELSIGLRW